jgi:hypothetical protein
MLETKKKKSLRIIAQLLIAVGENIGKREKAF